MKKIGIVCDDYKLPGFKKALSDAGFEYTTAHLGKKIKSTGIFIHVDDAAFQESVAKIGAICMKLEIINATRSN